MDIFFRSIITNELTLAISLKKVGNNARIWRSWYIGITRIAGFLSDTW